MSTTLAVNQLKAAVGWDYETVLAYGNAVSASSYSYSKSLVDGTGAGSANKIVIVQADGSSGGASTLAASASDAYDLSAFDDPFGTALSFAKVRAVYLENLSTTATFIKLESGASNAWIGSAAVISGTTPTLRVGPGGVAFIATNGATGYTVDSTHKTFKITNEDGSNAASYKLVVIGE